MAHSIGLLPWVFSLLMTISRTSPGASAKSLAPRDLTPAQQHESFIESMLAWLAGSDLVFLYEAAKTKRTWRLTRLGEDLIAEAVALQMTTEESLPTPAEILALPAAIQAALIRRLGDRHSALLLDLMTATAVRLTPPAFLAAVRVLARRAAHQDLLALLTKQMELVSNPFFKTALIDGMMLLDCRDDVGQTLSVVAESDRSPRARNHARTALARHRNPEPQNTAPADC